MAPSACRSTPAASTSPRLLLKLPRHLPRLRDDRPGRRLWLSCKPTTSAVERPSPAPANRSEACRVSRPVAPGVLRRPAGRSGLPRHADGLFAGEPPPDHLRREWDLG